MYPVLAFHPFLLLVMGLILSRGGREMEVVSVAQCYYAGSNLISSTYLGTYIRTFDE